MYPHPHLLNYLTFLPLITQFLMVPGRSGPMGWFYAPKRYLFCTKFSGDNDICLVLYSPPPPLSSIMAAFAVWKTTTREIVGNAQIVFREGGAFPQELMSHRERWAPSNFNWSLLENVLLCWKMSAQANGLGLFLYWLLSSDFSENSSVDSLLGPTQGNPS